MAPTEVSINMGHFPNRLMAILELGDEEVQKTMHWLPDGKAFTITKPDLFADTVLQKHFKGVQLFSFQKNLSFWGFKQTGDKIGSRFISLTFSHPLFLREYPELADTMKRMSMKARKAQKTPRITDYQMGTELVKKEIEAENNWKAAILQQISLPVIVPVMTTWHMQPMIMANHVLCPSSHPRNPQQVPQLPPLIHSLPSAAVYQPSVRDQHPNISPIQHEMPKPIQQQIQDRKQQAPVPNQMSENQVTLSRNELNAAIAMANMTHFTNPA